MTQTKCPKCGAATTPAMGRFYCPRCGWNRNAAERRLVRVQWIIPALIVIFDLMGIIALGIERHNWAGAILFATLPTLLLGFVYAGARQGLRRLRAPAMDAPPSGGDSTSFAAVANASASQERAEQYNFLISLPPPRPVRLSRRGKISMSAVLLIAFAAEALVISNLYGTWRQAASFQDVQRQEIFMLCIAALIVIFPFVVRRKMARDRNLAENGAVSIGRVTKQRTFKNTSAITYEFQDGAGQTVSGSGNDFTRSFYPGMTVPVFYEAQNSKRNVAACASFFEVVNPSGE